MSENRRAVLEMLAEGQVTTDEAERLLTALDDQPVDTAASETRPVPRYLRVVVEATEEEDGPVKVNARIPLQLLRAGVRLVSLVPVVAQDHIKENLQKQGLDIDLSQLRPENLEELIDQLRDLTVDVDQRNDNVKVRVFCE